MSLTSWLFGSEETTSTHLVTSDAMHQLGMVADLDEPTKRELANMALDIQSQTEFSAEECLRSCDLLARSGYNANQLAGALPPIAGFAAGWDMDLDIATDHAVTTVLIPADERPLDSVLDTIDDACQTHSVTPTPVFDILRQTSTTPIMMTDYPFERMVEDAAEQVADGAPTLDAAEYLSEVYTKVFEIQEVNS